MVFKSHKFETKNVYLIGHSPVGLFRAKQTMINRYSNEHNYIKNPNWQEADQLAIYKHSREDEGYREQHQLVIRTGFQIRRS